MSDDREAADPDTTATVELALSDAARPAPGRPCPISATISPESSPSAESPTGAAPSASKALVDRTVYDFLYRYWFRVAVEGIENVPAEGPALLVANHSGAIPV